MTYKLQFLLYRRNIVGPVKLRLRKMKLLWMGIRLGEEPEDLIQCPQFWLALWPWLLSLWPWLLNSVCLFPFYKTKIVKTSSQARRGHMRSLCFASLLICQSRDCSSCSRTMGGLGADAANHTAHTFSTAVLFWDFYIECYVVLDAVRHVVMDIFIF